MKIIRGSPMVLIATDNLLFILSERKRKNDLFVK
jgi:hypothetical protein